MRLLFVVQRYGREIAGGAEQHCREFATRLAGRGHAVEVVTTCARRYNDRANVYEPGSSELDGVIVHRLPVAEPRDDEAFGPLNSRVPYGDPFVPLHLQLEWMHAQGPYVPELGPWLTRRAPAYDVAIFFTYLYYTTWTGLPAAAGRVPTVLHPTAHAEPALFLPLYDTTFRHPSAFAFSTEEEQALVRRRFRCRQPAKVVGIGLELGSEVGVDERRFRAAFGLGDRRYLLFVGRLDQAKGTNELYDFFVAYKRRNGGSLALVLMGDPVRPLDPHDDVIVTGFVDDQTRNDALAGAVALAQPSFFESFSMVLTEAWAQRRPALVQGHCAVLEGQVRRSGGGLPYRGYAEFEAMLGWLLEHPAEARRMGEVGRRYTESRYTWDVVLRNYEHLLASTARRWEQGLHRPGTGFSARSMVR
jgi:glycosyltransferase involved in cell wall biosynthesis